MLPELNFKRRYGMDKSFYFEKKLKEFLTKNENTNETLSKYNSQTIMDLRDTEETLKVTKRKFGMLFYISICIKDYETIGHVRTIHNSLKEQLRLIEILDKTLLRTRIDNKWSECIKMFVCDKVIERCARLEKLMLPDLIKISKLNIYVHYLKSINTTLENDILNHTDDEDEVYYEHIMTVIKQHEHMMSKEELEELKRVREHHINIETKRKETIEKEKTQRKIECKEEFEKDVYIMLQNWATDIVSIEQRANGTRIKMLYKNALSILETLNDKLTGEDLSFKLIAIARYNNRGRISKSAFKWLKVTDCGYTLSGGFGGATPFFESLQPEKFNDALQYCKDKGYTIATVDCDITGKKKKEIVYDYYQIIPELTDTKHKEFRQLEQNDRAIFIQNLFHNSMSVLKCVMIICEAYSICEEASHPMNTNMDMKRLECNLAEIYDFNNCWKDDQLLNSNQMIESCREMRTRIKSLARYAKRSMVCCLDFALTDKDDIWVKTIKSIINFNSYTEEDLKRLYNVLQSHRKSNQLPNEFSIEAYRTKNYIKINHYIKSEYGDVYIMQEELYIHSDLVNYKRHNVQKLNYVEEYLVVNDSMVFKAEKDSE